MYSYCMVYEVSALSYNTIVYNFKIKLCQINCIVIYSPAQCILQSWTCYCESDNHDNWRTGL